MSKAVLKNVEKRFGQTIVVKDFNLTIEEGKFVSLLGPSGCGKTTILRMIAGLTEPTTGEIYLGENIVFSAFSKILVPPEKRNIGMVFQSYALWPHMNAFANVSYPLRIQKKSLKKSKDKIHEKTERYFKLVNLEGYENRFPHELSGGQQQRVSLARALIREPQLLLLDEPLSNLDAKLKLQMRHEIKQIQKKLNITTIYVTHDQQEALELSDTIVVMNEGGIEQIDSPEILLRSPKTAFVKDFFSRLSQLK